MIGALMGNEELWRRFTRAEEYNCHTLDRFGRFSYYSSGERDILEPSVSKFLIEEGAMYRYPNGHQFAVCLTHDIDSIYQSALTKGYAAISALRNGDFNSALGCIKHLGSRRTPLCNFQDIMDLEDEYGAKSSFYFLALAPGDQDYSYDVMDIEDDLKNIINAGWEVGLHGGHLAYRDSSVLEKEKNRLEAALGRPVIGYRNHYLCFRVPVTWENLARAGFLYDSTLGYADCAGFRNGMCHPFKPFNLITKQEIDILELPLIVMDGTLDQYMRLDAEGAWTVVRQLIDSTEKYHGVLTILWHNTYMAGERLKLYEKILQYCHGKGAWMTSGAEVAKWCIHDG